MFPVKAFCVAAPARSVIAHSAALRLPFV
jgi:hypothetical protein